MVKKFFLFFLIILFLVAVWLASLVKNSYFSGLTQRDGVTNFLLMGANGSGGGDSDLTDTIIFLSLNQKTGKGILISVPRDIWISEIQAKVNTAYHYGGIEMAKEVVSNMLGQEIHYGAVLDFNGFEKAVDLLGGITVNVQRAFDDYFYPIPGKEKDLCDGDKEFKCRYEHIRFNAGSQLMDGKTALKYVRSRNAEDEEGTDFARTERQQRFLLAFKEKLFYPQLYLNPQKLYQLYLIFRQHLVTDIEANEHGSLLLLISKISWREFKMAALNGNLFINPKDHYSKQWVLVPKIGSWQEIQNFVRELLES